MLFNSLEFICFFPLVSIIYFAVPHKYRWIILLAASYFFYMGWNPSYALLLLMTTSVTWLAGVLIEKTNERKRKWPLIGCLAINLGVLFVFKYYDFFCDNVSSLLKIIGIDRSFRKSSLILPVGISFFTFQAIGYAIDVYRGDIPAQKHFGKYALFVSFFPQLVAGPIERSRNLLPQFDEEHTFDYDRATSGLRLMAWGYFKKIVIADSVCVYVNNVYNNLAEYKGFPLLFATVLFSIQIFCDFSGYSDIARGCARIMGFRLMRNFDHPYFSVSVKEFWKRWHISLSTWLRDYIYIPLGGNRNGERRKELNLLITFLISGLWHGANWTFVAWGGIHAVMQIIESRLMLSRGNQLPDGEKNARCFGRCARPIVSTVLTFCAVSFAWIFFRANSMHDALYVIRNMFVFKTMSFSSLYTDLKMMFGNRAEVYRLLLTLPVFAVASFADRMWSLEKIIKRIRPSFRITVYVMIVVYILLAARAEMQDFIYFQF